MNRGELLREIESKMRARQECRTEAAADAVTHEIGLLVCGIPETILAALSTPAEIIATRASVEGGVGVDTTVEGGPASEEVGAMVEPSAWLYTYIPGHHRVNDRGPLTSLTIDRWPQHKHWTETPLYAAAMLEKLAGSNTIEPAREDALAEAAGDEITEAMWGGLARDIMMWLDFGTKTPRSLFKHLKSIGTPIPQWLRDEPEMQQLDHVPSKGTRCVIIYKAMREAAIRALGKGAE